MKIDVDPLFGPAPERVQLSRAPLVAVLAQARFPEIFSISKKEYVADFQEKIRRSYPRSDSQTGIFLNVSGGAPEAKPVTNWKFSNEEGTWVISLTTTFVTLQTTAYESRPDFIERLTEVLSAVAETMQPSLLLRLGVRYIDRVSGDQFARLSDLVESPGVMGLETAASLRDNVIQSMHDTVCRVAEGRLRARWGIIPAKGSHDPSLVEPIDGQSWVLDLDVYQQFNDRKQEFKADEIAKFAMGLSTRAYAVFRWAVTDKYLEAYGGNDA